MTIKVYNCLFSNDVYKFIFLILYYHQIIHHQVFSERERRRELRDSLAEMEGKHHEN